MDGPPQELRKSHTLFLTRLLLVYEEPGKAGDRISVSSRRIGQRHPKVRRHVGCCSGRRRGRAVDGRLDELSRLVPNRPYRQLVRNGVSELDISERAGSVLHLSRHALVSLAA